MTHNSSSSEKFLAIDNILSTYDQVGGSDVIPMTELRDQVSKIYSLSDQYFLYYFSAVARIAIALDARANRTTFKVSDKFPTSVDLSGKIPVVLSDLVQAPSSCDVYRPPRGFISSPASDDSRNSQRDEGGPRSSSLVNPTLLQRLQPPKPDVPLAKSSSHVSKPKRHRDSYSSDSCDESQENNLPANHSSSTTKKFKYPFDRPIEGLDTPVISPLASKVRDIFIRYQLNIEEAVPAFNRCLNKPVYWPEAMTQDLLEYKYIDLRKCYAEMLSNNYSPKKVLVADDLTGKITVKSETAEPIEITEQIDWRNLIELIRHAYMAVLPPASDSISNYFKKILKLAWSFESKVHWKDVRDYDVAIRQEFARRPYILFGDITSEPFRMMEFRILYGKHSRPLEPMELPVMVNESSGTGNSHRNKRTNRNNHNNNNSSRSHGQAGNTQ